MRVLLPPGFLAERRYIVEVLLVDLLGYRELVVEPAPVRDWVIELGTGRRVVVGDSFFSELDEQRWLKEVSAPRDARWMRHALAGHDAIPFFYGDDSVQVERDGIHIGADLFGSAFFMLTRWEETVSGARDRHGRFPAASSLASRALFLNQPVVDIWAGMLGRALTDLGHPHRPLRYQFHHTHDVDEPATFLSRRLALRAAGSCFLRRKPTLALRHLGIALGVPCDPLDSFDELMEIATRLGLRSVFYFLAEGSHPLDLAYSLEHPRIARLLRTIRSRGHAVGLHAGYGTLGDVPALSEQKRRLESVWGESISENRQHYLRFEAPGTWRQLEVAGLSIDSSCGYAEREGFRCGTGTPYRVFDVEQRRPLALLERPLIAMDGTLSTYQSLESDEVLARLRSLDSAARRHGSGMTLLVHNSFPRYPAFAEAYRSFVRDLAPSS